jgi:polyhydroxyalkanoate synthesis regulator phasin
MAATTIEKPKQLTQTAETKTEELEIKLPLEPFILNTPEGVISETGQNDIEWYLQTKLNGLDETTGKWSETKRDYHPLPKEFEWVWTTNRGTLPKRITSYYYKNWQVKLSPEIVTELGNRGKLHASKAQTIVMDMTDSIDWQDGQFGDNGSCFWGEKSGAKSMIEKHGFAVRAYKARDAYTIKEGDPIVWSHIRGYARAWLAEVRRNVVVVFNGYGESTLNFARLLALKFGCSYKRINLLNNGYDDGVLWINGAVGYLIGEHSKIEGFSKHDLGWPDIEDERYYCEVCEDRIHADETVRAEDRYGHTLTVCEGCSVTCDNCCNAFTSDAVRRFDGDRLCNNCRESILQDKLEEAKATLDKAQEKLDDLRNKVEEAEAAVEEAQAEVDRLESEVEN